MFWSHLYCLEVCHHCFVTILICHPCLTTACMYHLRRKGWPVSRESGKPRFGWAGCELHVLCALAISASGKVLALFSLLCKTCFEDFTSSL